MVGPIVQQIALLSYGNEYLRTGEFPVHFDLNSTFQFCNDVRFVFVKKGFLSSNTRETVAAKNPFEWFALLKKEKCINLRLYYQHSKAQETGMQRDYQLAGMVGGGGSWLMEAVLEAGYSDFWAGKWEGTKPDAPDRRIWSVSYSKVLSRQRIINKQPDLNELKAALTKSLLDICEFAHTKDLKNWAVIFEGALNTLTSSDPNEGYYHKDMIVHANYGLTAQQILFAAGKAWVFGGMGSWNDLGFKNTEDNAAYKAVSAALFEDICRAVVAAVNSF